MNENRTTASATGTMIGVLSTIGLLTVALIVLFALALTDWSGDRDPFGDRAVPTSAPPEAGRAAARRAAPPVNPAEWITADDYPADAVRRSEEGRVTIRLDMAAAGGRPLRCTVTASDASPSLERATCRAMMRSARFAPQDAPFTFSRAVQWRLPTD